jgi:hypothetical protein
MDEGALTSAFTCTNTLSSSALIGVEVFGASGAVPLNDASASSVVIAPGATVVLTTSGLAAFSPDSTLGLGGLVSKGSARVLTTTSFKASQQILCNAFLAERLNNPPTVMLSLPVIRK